MTTLLLSIVAKSVTFISDDVYSFSKTLNLVKLFTNLILVEGTSSLFRYVFNLLCTVALMTVDARTLVIIMDQSFCLSTCLIYSPFLFNISIISHTIELLECTQFIQFLFLQSFKV